MIRRRARAQGEETAKHYPLHGCSAIRVNMNGNQLTSIEILNEDEIDQVNGAGFWSDVGAGAVLGAGLGFTYGGIFGGLAGMVPGTIAGAVGGAIGAGASSLWG